MKESILKFCVMLLAFCTSAIHLQAMDEWDGKTIAKGFYSGTGTKANPYKIFTASQFLYFIQQIKDGNTFSGKYIELCNDIVFSYEAVDGYGDFYGDFDGNDHKIQVNTDGDESYYWNFCRLYGSMHDVQFYNACNLMSIYTGGILYNCKFEFNGYHGSYTISLEGGTIANCVSNSAYFKNSYKYGGASGFVKSGSNGYCSNCYFPITSLPYGNNTPAINYYGVIESCGEEAGNDWVQSHTERAYKSWPLTFSPTYPEYQIKEQPKSYNPSVVCLNSDEALYQWCYQERKPIIFENITFSSSTQTKNIVVSDNDVVLSFDFIADGYTYTGYNDGDDYEAWISVNGEKIVSTYQDKEGTYSCQASVGTYEISCERSTISNIRIIYPTEILANETSNVLSKQTIMGKPGAYFCQVSYGEGCDVMNSDYVDYEKLLTINNVTYVINEDATATVLWVADMAVNITIPETVCYDGVNYPVTSISSKAFVDCTSLASVKCKTLDAPSLLGGATFEGLAGVFIPSNITIYVPAGSAELYLKTDHWHNFNIIEELPIAESVTLDKTTAEMSEGETLTLTATVTPENATDKTVVWTSSDETVATVVDGVVTALKAGKTTITVTSTSNPPVSATCEIKVNAKVIPATGITLDKTTAELTEGETLTLTATVSPEDVTDRTVVWTSSDETVATVANGVVTALKAGKVTILAKSGDVSATCEIIVNAKDIVSTGDYTFIVPDITVCPQESFVLPIEMNNAAELSAFQCDIYIPEGITLQKNSKGKYDITLDSERSDDHTITAALHSDGSVRVVVVSMTSAPLFGIEGPLLHLNLLAGEELGIYTIDVKNISVSDVAGNLYNIPNALGTVEVYYKPGDANGDGSVAVNDAVLAVNKILGAESEEFKFRAADMNSDGNILVNDVVLIVNTILGVSLNGAAYAPRKNTYESLNVINSGANAFDVSLSNAGRYTAMQFDMELAEGADIADIKMSKSTDHSVAYRRIDDTTVRVVVTSLTNEALAEGAKLCISMKDAAGKTVAFTNGRAAYNNGQMVGIMPGNTVLGGTTGIDGINAEFAPADVYSIDGRIVKKNATTLDGLKPGLYVVNGRKVVVER